MMRTNSRAVLLSALTLGVAVATLGPVSAQDRTVRGVTILKGAGPDAPPQREASPVETRPAPAQPAAPAKCDRVFPTADVKFTNAAAFDRALNAQLLNPPHSGVIVDVDHFNPDAPPARLEAWFSAVQKTGGEINQQEIVCTRGFSFKKLMQKLFGPQENSIYEPAKNFNVVLWVEKASGEVTQVQFVGRTPA